jgi:hypothetical protein
VAGQERVVWNPTLSLPPKEYEFTDAEIARMTAAADRFRLSHARSALDNEIWLGVSSPPC